MSLNRDFIGKEFPEVTHTVTEKEIHEYSWAIGARNLTYYNYNGALSSNAPNGMAPPSFPVIYELPMLEEIWSMPELHGGVEEAEKNILMLVHGEQSMTFHNPVRPGDSLKFKIIICDIANKGIGELLEFKVTSKNQNGKKVVDSDWGLFIRGSGNVDKRNSGVKRSEPKIEEQRQLVFRKVIRVDDDITHRYSKASNDLNPIHTDENAAKKAGLGGVIVHGLCTMSMTMRAIIECYLDSDPYRLRQLSVRFSAPVYPGDILIADGWEIEQEQGNTKIGFEVIRKEDGVRVISAGVAKVAI